MTATSDLASMTPSLPLDLVAQTVDLLERQIMNGTFSPAAPLPSQGRLCNDLGVSRSVIREAMRVLQSRGLIEVSQGSRPRVVPARPDVVMASFRTFLQRAEISLMHLLELRRPLEVEIATLAARHITPEQLADLHAAVAELAAASDREAQVDADTRFHRILAEATGNPLFGLILDVLAQQLRESRRQTLAHSGVAMALGYHRRILAAVEAGDTEAARREMIGHVEQTQRDLEEIARLTPPPA
jgi:GntR family transcriptional repressor for pyruvate dehydrogenase complex